MNEFYSDKVKKVREGFDSNGDPLNGVKKLMVGKECQFSLRKVTEEDILMASRKMKNTKSMGTDDIPSDLLKKTIKWTCPAIMHIANLIIEKGEFPTKWKIAKVIPLLKVGMKLCPQIIAL